MLQEIEMVDFDSCFIAEKKNNKLIDKEINTKLRGCLLCLNPQESCSLATKSSPFLCKKTNPVKKFIQNTNVIPTALFKFITPHYADNDNNNIAFIRLYIFCTTCKVPVHMTVY